MPFLNRKPFSPDSPPSDLNENEEIFICRQTNEVFRDYDSFFKRTILCNSLVWSCGVTLKPGLTYEEALKSEEEARKVAEHIPVPIQRGVLTLVHYTRHSRLDNLCDEVYNYIRDRYQEGEEVDVKYNGEKCAGHIHKVIEPELLTNGLNSSTSSPVSKDNGAKKLSSPHTKSKASKNSNLGSPNEPDSSIIVLSDDESQGNSKDVDYSFNSPSSPKPVSAWPNAKGYQYEVKLKNTKNVKARTSEFITAKYTDISRRKGAFSRDKLKLLLRVTCCRSTAISDDGYWKVIDEYREKFDLAPDVHATFENISSKRKSKKRKNDRHPEVNGGSDFKKRKKCTSKEKEKKKKKKFDGKEVMKKDKSKKNDKLKKGKGLKKMSAEEIERAKLEMKIQREREKEERKRERDVKRELKKKEREKARQEKQELLKEQKLFLLRWCVPQEDLDLNDLKDLPTPVPVSCKLSGEMFGNIVMVLEFVHIFGEFFDIKQDFPDGVSLDMVEEALTEHDAEGVFYDMVKFLLQCILKTHAEEEEEEGLDDSDVQAHDPAESGKEKEKSEEEDSDSTRLQKAVSASASMAAAWTQLYQGKNLHELTLDPFTCSEILRLHLLSSGARLVSGTDGDAYRWQKRGGFTFADDAGVAFRHREHGIMRALVTGNIYDLDPSDKLKLLCTLCSQLLTYATTRDIIDDGFDRLRKAKREWQEEQWADQRKDKEEAAARYRKRQAEKAREREQKEKKLAESKNESQGGPKNEATEEDSCVRDSMEEPMTEDGSKEQLDREERKERMREKEKAFVKELRKSQGMSGVQPIGTDRIFRRYWLFNSMSGLFIEDDDSELYKLLQAKDNENEISDDDSGDGSLLEPFDENSSTMSGDVAPSLDPEDDSNKTPNICSLTKEQIQVEKELCRILKLYNIPLESLTDNSPLTRGGFDEKKEQNFEKLRTRNIVQWSYLDKKEDFDKLLSSLNPRGLRERNLRDALSQYYQTIVERLQDNPVRLENRERNEAMQVQRIARSKRGGLRNQPQGVDKTLYKTMEDFIEANLRDHILDLEDRIWQGGLGSVKTNDISAWRKQIENGIYDFLPASGSETTNEAGKTSVNGLDVGVHGTDHEKMEVDEEKETVSPVAGNRQGSKPCKPSFLPCLEDSRPATPVDGSFSATPTTLHTPRAINPCVRVLAKAVLEVEQGIERKYLIPPLGDDEETKKRKQQEAADAAQAEFYEMMAAGGKRKKDKMVKNENEESGSQDCHTEALLKTEPVAKQQKTLLERWEDSLMVSTNLSQVFIHLTNLDNCISWDKSVLNARCRICRRKGDAEHMLLCDGCDRGHHMYCLKPPIKEVPEGDWFCSSCRPKEPRRSFRKNRRKIEESDEESGDDFKTKSKREEMEESDEGEDGNDSEEEVEEEDSEDEEDSDMDDDEEEGKEDEEEEKENDEVLDSDEDGSVHMETCACCDGSGELLCCETCPLAYHLECAYPPLRRVPRGSWACQVCTGADSELPAGRKVKKSVIKAAQKRASENEESLRATKRAKISTKKTSSNTDTRRTLPVKRHTYHSELDNPSPAPVTRSAKASAVRVGETKSTTPPHAPMKSSGRSNSAPRKITNAKTNTKWTGQAKTCEKLLKEITDHEDAWPFLYPVDEEEVPGYKSIIKSPMDLKTIKTKLSSRQYNSAEEFTADMRQIFFNCAEFNNPRTREARAGVRLSAFFETRFGELGLDATESRTVRTRRSR